MSTIVVDYFSLAIIVEPPGCQKRAVSINEIPAAE